ncbi:hypothetical protein H9P43_001926 [Blastocladiella emersonii ATCC 22665]|nr:hypothetical protein H9P43_001926 [Blastocladiella emersonii ATCC 22665]
MNTSEPKMRARAISVDGPLDHRPGGSSSAPSSRNSGGDTVLVMAAGDASSTTTASDSQANLLRGSPSPSPPATGNLPWKDRLHRLVHGPTPPIELSLGPPWMPRFAGWFSNLVPSRWRGAYLTFYHVVMIASLLVWTYLANYAAVTYTVDSRGARVAEVPAEYGCRAQPLLASKCGVLGIDCRPFATRAYTVRCPADCGSARSLSAFYVGGDVAYLVPPVIGNGVYRGDSWACVAGVHAGVLQSAAGGCMRVVPGGEVAGFASAERNGITSLAFNGTYPASFRVEAVAEGDQQWCGTPVGPATAYFYVLLPWLLLGHPSAGHWVVATACYVFYFVIFLGVDAQRSDDFITSAVAQLTPYVAVTLVLVRLVFARILPRPLAAYPVETLGLVLAPALAMLFLEVIQGALPPFTLTSALFASASRATLGLVLLAVFLVAASLQGLSLYRTGTLARTALEYTVGSVLLFAVPPLLSLSPHVHHYMVGMFLMPALRWTRTRTALVFLGVLWGLFMHGIARWGFDSPLTTALAARQAVGLLAGTPRPVWNATATAATDDGVSLAWSLAIPRVDGAGKRIGGNLTDLVGAGGEETAARAGIAAYAVFLNDVEVQRTLRASVTLAVDAGAARGGMIAWTDPMAVRVVPRRGGAMLDSGPVLLVWRNGTTKELPAWKPT